MFQCLFPRTVVFTHNGFKVLFCAFFPWSTHFYRWLELIVWSNVNFGCSLCPLSISLIRSSTMTAVWSQKVHSTIRHEGGERIEIVVVWYIGFNKLSSCSCEVYKAWAWMDEGHSTPSVRDRLFRSGYPHARHVVGNGGKNSADNPFILLSRAGNDHTSRLPGSSVSFTVIKQIAYHDFVWICNMFEWRCKTGFRCSSAPDCLLPELNVFTFVGCENAFQHPSPLTEDAFYCCIEIRQFNLQCFTKRCRCTKM